MSSDHQGTPGCAPFSGSTSLFLINSIMSSIDSAVFVSVVMLLLKISFCSTLVFSFWCIDLHSFSACSCVSFTSPQPLHVMLLYLPRKLFFMSSIRVLALNIVLTWNLFSWFIYFGLVPTFQLLIPSSRCFTFDLEFPALFILFLKSLSITSVTLFFCWCFVVSFFSSSVVSPIFSIVCMVMFFQFWLLSMSVIVDIRFLFLFFFNSVHHVYSFLCSIGLHVLQSCLNVCSFPWC